MSIKLMTSVWDTAIGPATRRLVLLALADIANDEGEAWPSIDTIARRASCSRTTAEDSLRSLADDHIIARESRGFHRSNRYRINLSALTPGIRVARKTPGIPDDDPRIPGRETPENPGTEPSVEPPTEPSVKPSSSATPDGATDTITNEDHDLLGQPIPSVKANGSTRPRTNSTASTTGVAQDPGSADQGSVRTIMNGEGRCRGKAKTDQPDPLFEEFWVAYAHKIGKGAARKAWGKATRVADPRKIINAAARYAKSRVGEESRYTAHPTSWLNGERWTDEYLPDRSNGTSRSGDTRSNGHQPWQASEDQSGYDEHPFMYQKVAAK